MHTVTQDGPLAGRFMLSGWTGWTLLEDAFFTLWHETQFVAFKRAVTFMQDDAPLHSFRQSTELKSDT